MRCSCSCCSCSCSLPLSVNSFGQAAAAAQLGVCDIFQMLLLQQNKSGDKYKVSRSRSSESALETQHVGLHFRAWETCRHAPCLAATLPQSFGSRTRNRFWQRHTTADDGVTIPVDQRACSGSCSPFLRRLRCLAATSCCCRCSCACTHACPKLFRQHSFKAADEAASAAASTAAASAAA